MLKQYFLDIMRKECNGLYLCEVPTGIGKSYQAAHAMEEYVKEIREEYAKAMRRCARTITDERKLIYLTPLRKNVGEEEEELKKAYENEELFEKEVLHIKSNVDNIIENLGKVTIPQDKQPFNYDELKKQVKAYNGESSPEIKKIWEDKVEEEERKFRKEIKNTLSVIPARERLERIKNDKQYFGLNINMDDLTVTTFNAFGDKIVHENFHELGFEKEPRLIDDIEKSKIIAEILRDNVITELDYRNFYMSMPFVKGALPTAKKAFEIIKRENLSNASDADILKTKMRSEKYDITATAAAELIAVYGEYDDCLHKNNLIEYADQELLIFELLKKNPFYFEDYGFEHIIVDEFQDTSQLQFEILKNIINSSLEFKSFLVVGDDSQSIFGFRGSDPRFIIEFEKKLGEDVQDFYLLENHRSTENIINFANKINSLNQNRVVKDLIPTREKGEPVVVEAFEKKDAEEDYIISVIKKKIEEKHPLEDIAYIASTRSQLLKMGTRLTEEGIQWIMLNPEPMFSNSRIEGALALARYLTDDTATKDLFVYLNAVNDSEILEKKADEEILAFMEKQKKSLSFFDTDVDDSVKKKRLVSYLEFLKGNEKASDEVYEAFLKKVFIWDTYKDMLEYILDFGLYGEKEAAKRCKDYPGIVLTTAHSSKGMEWPIVINEISKYHDKNLVNEDVEEKRRLFFVSATRARDELYIVSQRYAYGSKGNGKNILDTRVQNRFLEEAVKAVIQK